MHSRLTVENIASQNDYGNHITPWKRPSGITEKWSFNTSTSFTHLFLFAPTQVFDLKWIYTYTIHIYVASVLLLDYSKEN